MTIKVLGIAGSPRRGGNTEILLDRALGGATSQGAESEKLVLSELEIAPCLNCDDCLTAGECSIPDHMDMVYPKLRQADCLILASPIFFRSVSAQTKAMIDRCQALWVTKYMLHRQVSDRKRQGLFISVGHWKGEGNFRGAITVVRAFFATLDVKYEGELLFGGVEKKGEILQHPTACWEAFDAGARLATITKPPEG